MWSLIRLQEIQGLHTHNVIQLRPIIIETEGVLPVFWAHTSLKQPLNQTWHLWSFASHKTHVLCTQLKHLCSWTLIEHSCDEPRRAQKAVSVQLSPKDTARVAPFACWHQLSPLSSELFCCQHSPAIRVYNQSKVSLQFYYEPTLLHSSANEHTFWCAYSLHCIMDYRNINEVNGMSSWKAVTQQVKM